jgi:hypothetical protein
MAEKNDGGDKTEKPTAKRLRDSRKKGDVPKSRELTSTVGLAVWLALGAGVLGHATDRLAALTDQLLGQIARGWPADGFASLAASQGWLAAELVHLAGRRAGAAGGRRGAADRVPAGRPGDGFREGHPQAGPPEPGLGRESACSRWTT